MAGHVNTIHTTNGYSVLTVRMGLAIILLLPKIAPRIPFLLGALLIPIIISFRFFSGKAKTNASENNAQFSFATYYALQTCYFVPAALTIAALGTNESLLPAVVAARI